jgi:hypothetical protein
MNRIEIIDEKRKPTDCILGYLELSYTCDIKVLIDLFVQIPDIVEFFNEHYKSIGSYKIRIRNSAGTVRAKLNINRNIETTTSKKLGFVISGFRNFDRSKSFSYVISITKQN